MKKEVILITGASGLVAKRLAETWGAKYVLRWLTRKKKHGNEFEWNVKENRIDVNALVGVNHIIHLAGAGIADKRWTNHRKREIKSSRVDTAKLIATTLRNHNIEINSFVTASAIGFYGTTTSDKTFVESDKRGNDFLSDVCTEWEKAAEPFTTTAERTAILRIGIVLSKEGGALSKMTIPIKYYVGATLGKGNQYMPWIHIDDLCSMFNYIIDHKSLKGVFNAVSPEPVTNKEFTEALAKVLNKPLWLPNVPNVVIKTIFGEAATLLLSGSKVSSKKITATGFEFKYANVTTALLNLLKR